MAIPESRFEVWAKQGAIVGSSTTYATVKSALEASSTKYASKNYTVFLQGSYGNDTNIYAESDVDVVIRLDSIYYYDTKALTPQDLAIFKANSSPGTYAYADFKADVTSALQNGFGVVAVKPGNRAIKILPNNNRRSADVIVTTDFHLYYSASGLLAGLMPPQSGPSFISGVCFFTSDGKHIVNYPKQHSANCSAKHQTTNGWFKPMVRIFNNMRSKLVETGAIQAGSVPSYFIEGLLFNVPDDKFGKSYSDTFVAAMNWLLQAPQNTLMCANMQHALIMDSVPTCWPCSDCTKFLNGLAQMWRNWA